ncbi:hypothetical protein NDK43_20160 [Neobacillus pocheonensis]|uniref:Uncharacterized protein n=1 Tax=Neobacillus pocheonensis TaxID=363869 RepID=A0ABT0WD39_9BACI|nr:hypothetical protein [Neobacillus pocheonensis]
MSIKLFVKKARYYRFIGVFLKFVSLDFIQTRDYSQEDLNNLKITGEGVDDQELAHFGGLDLHVKVTKMMISNTNGLDFAKKSRRLFSYKRIESINLMRL